jgi:DNA-binding transcriptional ArsR family regulator
MTAYRRAALFMKDADVVFKALADRSRRELLDRLYERNGQTLSELCKGLDMARQSVSQHLDLLEAANLISVQWQGREKLHYVNPVPIHEIYERWIRKFEEQRLLALHAFKTKLERARR